MTDRARARAIAQRASGLAAGAGTVLPDSLLLWQLAGSRPRAAAASHPDPAGALGEALESMLTDGERRRGAHYTPRDLADRVAAMAVDAAGTVVDPTCGGGALLLAAGRRLVAGGIPADTVARELLWGADVDPLAAAVTEAAVAIWSGGVAPAPGHVVVADSLELGPAAWPAGPASGFGALVGNPPFQGQLARDTARPRTTTAQLRARFGTAVTPYVDTAALFLLAGADLVAPGRTVAMILPQSVAASRGAAPAREALAARSRLRDLWAPDHQPFGARVHVCVAAIEVTGPHTRVLARKIAAGAARTRARTALGDDWAGRLASARGVPDVELRSDGTVGDLAVATAGFRDEYYGLVGHVREAGEAPQAPLVTSGLIGIGSSAWGTRQVRFAKQHWCRPEVDLAGLRADDERIAAWVERLRRPKVVVASQTRVLEAAADANGTWVPSTPVVSVLPHEAGDVHRLAAALCAPPVAAWAARRTAGSALSRDAMRVSASLVQAAPLPADHRRWREASRLLQSGDLDGYGMAATAMYGLYGQHAEAVLCWWSERVRHRTSRG